MPYWLMAVSFIGIGDTLFLSYEKYLGIIPSCAILNGCEKVLTSAYAEFLGVPLAYLGLVFYVYMLGLAFLLSIDPNSKGLRLGALLYTGIGFGLSIAFELIQFFLIGAMCLYCAISAATASVLFVLAVVHFRSPKE